MSQSPLCRFSLLLPKNASVKVSPALEQLYLLLGHSREILFFVGSVAIYLGSLVIAGPARNRCKTTPRSSRPRTQVVGLFAPWKVSSSTYVLATIPARLMVASGRGAAKKIREGLQGKELFSQGEEIGQ